jgi:hypothetical protein
MDFKKSDKYVFKKSAVFEAELARIILIFITSDIASDGI